MSELTRRRRLRRKLLEADPHCRYCRRPVRSDTTRPRFMATIDHILPQNRGGRTEASNVVLACEVCNMAKGDRTPEEWAAAILGAR